SLSVSAVLDKQIYKEGDTARLTLSVVNQNAGPVSNFAARINYAGFEDQRSFALNGSESMVFDIPLPRITGEKLFYGIYSEMGRSLHLNSVYIYKEEDVLQVTTDKQVYSPGETVSVMLMSPTGATGMLTLTGPKYTETFFFSGPVTKSFSLPSPMTGRTCFIKAQLSTQGAEPVTVLHPFDVAGVSVKVKEAILDKAKYAASDTVTVSLIIESNQDISAFIKMWIVFPGGEFIQKGAVAVTLSPLTPLVFSHQVPLETAVSGIHRLFYGVYLTDCPLEPTCLELLLASGAQSFDVGDVILYELSTDRGDYPAGTEPVTATLMAYGTIDATLELQLDGLVIRTQEIPFSSTVKLNLDLGPLNPGSHTLKAILRAGGLASTKETSFDYALSLADSDKDGISDAWERAHGLDLNDASDAVLDSDNYGLSNLEEFENGTSPNRWDTDFDKMPDGWEVAYG
ncbi:MAG: hypothetical protein FJY85_16490, partial [Deltaproteobacteria bacterium]|nr:hypothetical protein [Deltaproteobacteria bacterium]